MMVLPRVLLVAMPLGARQVWFTPFIGREREVGRACALLGRDGVQVVTLTGPGGVGKTRLASVAGEKSALARGQRFLEIDLSPISDPELVLLAIAQGIGVRDTGRGPLERQVIQELREEPTLLLLDNFEQVIEAAPLLTRLLAPCGELQILTTSRERLRISAEHAMEVPPLTLPEAARGMSAELLLQYEAVALFLERAAASSQDFELTERNAGTVADICTHLDGLPLAIELAAARVPALPLPALLERLGNNLPMLNSGSRDRPERQRTMRDAISWSYDLLSDEEQALFRHLAVFAGGFTLPAAEAVAPSATSFGELLSLVDKSLLRPAGQPDGPPRFRMLETVREFGLERLAAADELDGVCSRHATFFLELAETRDPTIPIPGDFEWIARMTPDQENLRLALISLQDAGDWRRLLRLAAALDDFWQVRGQYDEASRWLLLALDRDPAAPADIRVKVLAALGQLAYFRGNYAETRSYWEQELELARVAGLECAYADKLARLGSLASRDGDLDRAASLLTEAHARFVKLSPDGTPALRMIGRILDLLGDTAILQGNLDLAARHYEQAIEQLRSTNDPWMLVDALGGLGVVELSRGNPIKSGSLYLEALEIGMSDANLQHNTSILAGLGAVAAELGQPERAARLLGAAEALRDRLGAVIYPRDKAVLERCLTRLQAELDDSRYTALNAEGRSLGHNQVLAEAGTMLTVDAKATAIAARGEHSPSRLTSRELDVLRLIVEGRSDAQIGAALFISRRTVTTHTSSIFGKLGVTGRTEAAAMAVRRGIV
jgi:predicted ATPase/DNA-binding CsgD family transcriptional regulator